MPAKICTLKTHILSRMVNSSPDTQSVPLCSKCLLPLKMNENFVRKRATRNRTKYYHVTCGRMLNVI
ncbi:MAG: hypothetical protein ABI347_01325 [Nitrososphaera sp.]|jgi:hypothetical protein